MSRSTDRSGIRTAVSAARPHREGGECCPPAAEPAHNATLRDIAAWVRERLGIHFAEDKYSVLALRMRAVSAATGVDDLRRLHAALIAGRSPDLEREVAAAVSTNHTRFFREEATFAHFSKEVLPSLSGATHLRLWSAAASTGQEAYSIGMSLCDHFGLANAHTRCAILGTDISQQAIALAESGSYERIDGIAPEAVRKYLLPHGAGYQIRPEVARLCMFRRLNLMNARWPFQRRFHVIFCRNVLYYFEPALQQALLQRMHEHAEPGAYLITSVTESLRGLDVPWRPTGRGTGFYIKETT